MAKIGKIIPRQIIDSRGHPTVEVDVYSETGAFARASVPSGASTGQLEALELRDGNFDHYKGRSVAKAIDNISQQLAPLLIGRDAKEQEENDNLMIQLDGTSGKGKLGANSILPLSLAMAKLVAVERGEPLYKYLAEIISRFYSVERPLLPFPMMNLINGGKHACNNLAIQEFMIVCHGQNGFGENLRAGVEVFHTLKEQLEKSKYSTNVGDEGGFAPEMNSHRQVLDTLLKAIEGAGYSPGEDISLALDSAASEFYHQGHYQIEGNRYSVDEMIEYYRQLVSSYPLYSIEDGLEENGHAGWHLLTKALGKKVLLVGDDLFVTNAKILQRGIANNEANAILIKPNQVGTLSETFATLALAHKNNYKTIISHRSGETADSFIADLAVACACGHIKTGAPSRSERTEKYNQLLRIEESLTKQRR